MKICAISDTHELEHTLNLPKADILIHCGDWTYTGSEEAYLNAFNWLCEQAKQFKWIIFIMGNHDFNHKYFIDLIKNSNISNIHYLENSGVKIDGIQFFGVPYVPNLPRWAFPEYDGCYDQIPDDTQILISHCPMYGVLDNNSRHYGSSKLRNKITYDLPNLTHLFCGHIHENYGQEDIEIGAGIVYKKVKVINASTCNLQYKAVNQPIVIEI